MRSWSGSTSARAGAVARRERSRRRPPLRGKRPRCSRRLGAASKSNGKPRIPEFDADESLAELRTLAESAGAEVVGEMLQRRDRPDPATLIGVGKLEEIAGASASANADVLLFDHDLSPSQQRNIEKIIQRRVIDRTQLILDIFARHARTREGQLQVELAQLQYMMPRLAGHGVEMSQLGGGIGTRGPGETKLETDRRKVARRVRHVEQQLENVRRIRRSAEAAAGVGSGGDGSAGGTDQRGEVDAVQCANPGQSAGISRACLRRSILRFAESNCLRNAKSLMSDTVGFIRNLPHTLVSAFRATLEEVQRASLILHVSDASNRLSAEQDAQVEIVLKELEAEKKPRLRVMNKIDLLDEEVAKSLQTDASPRGLEHGLRFRH